MASDLQMVKMMLDLPLNSTTGAPAGASTGGSGASTGKLFATTIRDRAATGPAPNPALNTRMRASAVAAAADAAPRDDTDKRGGGGKNIIWAVAAGVVILAAAGAWYATRGGPSPGATSTSAAPAAGGAKAPAGGRGAGATNGADLVSVSSVPAGARITLNGTDTGKVTPAPLALGGKVPSTIELSLKGYQPLSANLTDADLKAGNKEFKLLREAGPVRLSVSGTYPVEVMQGEKVLSAPANKHEVTIQPGASNVTVRSKEYLLNWPVSIDFQRSSLDVTVPAPGTLTVYSQVETCMITADGQDIDYQPILKKPIAAGSHTIGLKCPDGKSDSQKVSVAAGENLTVKFGPPKTSQ
jgi:hypothetical protein